MKNLFFISTAVLFSLFSSGQSVVVRECFGHSKRIKNPIQRTIPTNPKIYPHQADNGCLRDSSHTFAIGGFYNRTYYYYNNDAQQIEAIVQNMDGEIGTNFRQFISTYTPEGKLEFYTEYTWDDDEWTPFYQTQYTYDGDVINDVTYSNWIADDWVVSYRSTYTHDAGLLVELFAELWQNEMWFPSSLITYTYTENGDLEEELSQNYMNEMWNNSTLHVNSYNDLDQLVLDEYFYWSNEAWTNLAQYSHSFNAEGYESQMLCENWQNNDWSPVLLFNYSYDIHGNVIHEEQYNWSNDEWGDTTADFYHFYDCTNVAIFENDDFARLGVFPNPSSGTVQVTLQEPARLQLYSVQGQLIHVERLNAGKSTTIMLPQAKGVYLLQAIGDSGQTYSSQLVKH